MKNTLKQEQSIIIGFEKSINDDDLKYVQIKFEFIKNLFSECGVRSSIVLNTSEHKISLLFEQTFYNVMTFLELFTTYYNNENINTMNERVEYMKYVSYMAQKMEKEQNTIIKDIQDKVSIKKISEKMCIPKKFIKKFSELIVNNSIINSKDVHIPVLVFRNIIQFLFPKQMFMKKYKLAIPDNSVIFSIPIDSINEINTTEIVYDFETVSETHNFNVNGIFSSNCTQN
jgi:hypothetical protein